MIITMPPNLFYNVTIPCALWFISKGRKNRGDRTLFIDARKMGKMITRKDRVLEDEDIKQISDIYHQFVKTGQVDDKLGFSKVATLEEIAEQDYILTPGRYVGFEDLDKDTEPFETKFPRLKAELLEQFKASEELTKRIRKNLEALCES